MVGVAFSIAIAFVYNGPRQDMARDIDALGLGTIAPADSEGILVDHLADVERRALPNLEGRSRSFDQATLADPDDLLALGYAELAQSAQSERVLIATGFDDAAIARVRARAERDHIRVLAGPPSLAREVLAPAPPVRPLRQRCPENITAFAIVYKPLSEDQDTWSAIAAALALLLAAASLARVAARPRLL
ncbi:MAG TPA: hypothetical protein VMJ10_26230 [Kofleriaceae bacterium]|nr:hypothetical protein [Kofleriaceae bacterium]